MRCRLYLVTPTDLVTGDLDPERFLPDFEAALGAGDVAAVLLRTEGGDEARLRAIIETLRPPAQAADAAVVIEGRADLAAELGCDGVHLEARPQALRAVRKALGPDLILGADCGESRHAAMVAGELEVDYVAFDGRARDPLAWWAELMELPCVALGGVTLDNAPELVDAGVDFLAPGAAVWRHPDGAAAAVAAFEKICKAG